MEIILFLQYLIIGIISISGLFVGKLLSLISPEEIHPYKKNLFLFQKVIFIIILIFFCFIIPSFYGKIFVLLILAYFLFKIKNKYMHIDNSNYLVYTLLGLLLGFTSLEFIIYPAFLIFLLGFSTAILNNNKNIDVFVKMIVVFMFFYVTSSIIFF